MRRGLRSPDDGYDTVALPTELCAIPPRRASPWLQHPFGRQNTTRRIPFTQHRLLRCLSGPRSTPGLRRDLLRTPSDCRPHLAASPSTYRLPVGHQSIDWARSPDAGSRAVNRGATLRRTALHQITRCRVCDARLRGASLCRVFARPVWPNPVSHPRGQNRISSLPTYLQAFRPKTPLGVTSGCMVYPFGWRICGHPPSVRLPELSSPCRHSVDRYRL